VLIGIISDTHGTLDPSVHTAFEGVERILHAGDVGPAAILHELETIAPVDAVAGNTDVNGECSRLPHVRTVTIAGARIAIVHDLASLLRSGIPEGVSLVVSGHTHVPDIVPSPDITYVNPGSASHPRSTHGPSVALIEITGGRIQTQVRYL